MREKDQLQRSEDNWVTNLGAWFAGERVVLRGKDLFSDLFDESWMSIWMLSITGRRFPEELVQFWSRMWVICCSFPEPRLWNNRVGALSGTARSTAALAVGSATAVSEAKTYGRQADVRAYGFISKIRELVDSGIPLDEVLEKEITGKHQVPPGFGRPIVSVDERILPVQRLVKELGVYVGQHYKLAFEVDEWLLRKRYRLRLNAAGISAALAADHGLSLREYNMIVTLAFSAGIVACYADSVIKPAGTFFPLRCERVAYEGVSPRKWEN